MTVLGYRSGIDERAGRSSLLPSFSWAIYLGMSWTWCIGMFLPVLLIRDFGPLSFGLCGAQRAGRGADGNAA